jgi:hypothetical protein
MTDEQISLAWSPMPPFESMGSGDGRMGGSAGIDFNGDTRRARWVRARYLWLKQERHSKRVPFFDPAHVVCRCAPCCLKRLLRMLNDLDLAYMPATEIEPAPETIQ